MKHEPGSLKPSLGARFCGRIVGVEEHFHAECWAEFSFPSHFAEEVHEAHDFSSATEATSWIIGMSERRGFAELSIENRA